MGKMRNAISLRGEGHAAPVSGPTRRHAALFLALLLLLAWLALPAMARGPDSVADLAEELQDSVVNISTTQTMQGPQEGVPLPQVPEGSPFEEFFNDFFNEQERDGPSRRVSSLGSGFVIDPSGLIVTNNHVIEGADEIVVNFNDGSKLKVVKVLGHDTKTDLALLQVEPKAPLKAVTFGDSGKMRVGDWVIAIGNPFGLGGSVTLGIISALKRDINAGPYDDFLQTDAAINRGNSGGPLFDMDGKVIGVNTAIISPTGGSIGIGFAVPSNTALQIIQQLKEYGETRRGWLGVHVQNITDEIALGFDLDDAKGALVAEVTPDSPAAEGGLKPGDVIVKFDGQPIETMRALPRLVAGTDVGKEVEVELVREGKTLNMKVLVGQLPEEELVEELPAPAIPPEGEEEGEEDLDLDHEQLLGLSIAPLTDDLRTRYGISGDIQGVVITEVDPDSAAAKNEIKAGEVILEVAQEQVRFPQEVLARVELMKEAGRRVQLLIADVKGNLRFVALPTS
jgi:serine protease Do